MTKLDELIQELCQMCIRDRRNAMLVKLLDGIGAMKLGEYKENTIDAFGDAYEYLMSKMCIRDRDL